MTLLEVLAEWRSQMADEEAPYLWDDPSALRYLIDAQDKFVRLTGGILDYTTTALTDIPLVANAPWAAYSPLILRMRDVGRTLTAGLDVHVANRADIEALKAPDYGVLTSLTFDDTDTGDVKFAVLGMDEKQLRLVKVPLANDTLRVAIFRLPYPRIVDWETVPLEIDEQHHLELITWMKYRAYCKHDAETYDKKLAAEYKEAFEAYCAEAKAEKTRRNFRSGAIRYGGI